jgi:Arc/MetJ-type ribon-helix-helix transcriptional regulator
MSEPSKRVMTPMSEALIAEINNFRFETRRESQSDAVRELLRRGLESWHEEKAAKAKKKPG